MKRSKQALAIAVGATVVLLALDLGTKEWASGALSIEHPGTPPEVCAEPGRNQRLRGESVVLVEGLLELSYAENCGAAFGLLNDSAAWVRKSVFGLAAVAAAVFLFLFFVQGKGGALFAYSVPLVVSGAVGNLADRVRLGYVVDFIRVHYDEPFDLLWWHFDRFEYPTFNVADITITIGVVLLVLDGIVEERRLKREAQAGKREGKVADAEPEQDAGAKETTSKAGGKGGKAKRAKGAKEGKRPAPSAKDAGADAGTAPDEAPASEAEPDRA
ncbi:MAG: signal peptidase II [Sandaracinaceae bacterium]|nr:signal peptidase II [Sandaracinaceae bacterium]